MICKVKSFKKNSVHMLFTNVLYCMYTVCCVAKTIVFLSITDLYYYKHKNIYVFINLTKFLAFDLKFFGGQICILF